MVDRLAEDHANATRLAAGLAGLPGIFLDPELAQTNIVIFEVSAQPALEFIGALKAKGVLVTYPGGRKIRMVTHHGIGAEEVEEALDVVEVVVRKR